MPPLWPVIVLATLLNWIPSEAAEPQSLLPAAGAADQRPRTSILTTRESRILALVLTTTLLLDRPLREVIQENRGGMQAFVDGGNAFGNGRYLLPGLGGTYLVGLVVGSPGVSRAALRAAEAFAVAGGASVLVKAATGRLRPRDGGDPDRFAPFSGAESFPSGHTTAAFAVATALSEESPHGLVDAGLYTAAGLTVFAPLHDDKHWLSDALAGALLGHLAGRWATRSGVAPAIDLGTRGASLSVHF